MKPTNCSHPIHTLSNKNPITQKEALLNHERAHNIYIYIYIYIYISIYCLITQKEALLDHELALDDVVMAHAKIWDLGEDDEEDEDEEEGHDGGGNDLSTASSFWALSPSICTRLPISFSSRGATSGAGTRVPVTVFSRRGQGGGGGRAGDGAGDVRENEVDPDVFTHQQDDVATPLAAPVVNMMVKTSNGDVDTHQIDVDGHELTPQGDVATPLATPVVKLRWGAGDIVEAAASQAAPEHAAHSKSAESTAASGGGRRNGNASTSHTRGIECSPGMPLRYFPATVSRYEFARTLRGTYTVEYV